MANDTHTRINKDDIEYFDSIIDGRTITNRIQAISATVDKARMYDRYEQSLMDEGK